jgi:3-oxoadipate CoA-transferase, beta subunit
VPRHIPPDREVVLHCENGVIGMGRPAVDGEVDWQLVDAGKMPITVVPGASYASHADSFAMIRGGHLDVAVLGAFQVSMLGDIANWYAGEGVPGVGGAMDLATGARNVRVITAHNTKDGSPKLVRACSLPLTALAAVNLVYTELGIFRPCGDAFVVEALTDEWQVAEVQERTGAPLIVDAPPLRLPR